MPDLSTPPETLLQIPQAADWPGISIPIAAADGTARTSLNGCTVHGSIRSTTTGPTLYTWSTTPTTGQGQVTLVGGNVVFGVPGAHSALWTFTRVRWQMDLLDPNAPAGLQNVRVGQGEVLVLPSYNT